MDDPEGYKLSPGASLSLKMLHAASGKGDDEQMDETASRAFEIALMLMAVTEGGTLPYQIRVQRHNQTEAGETPAKTL